MKRAGRGLGLPALAALLVVAACSGGGGSDAGGSDDPARLPGTTAPTTTSTTEAPLTGEPLVASEQGLSSFPDPFDPSATLGGYGVVLQNPNADVMATGVQVTTRVLDAAGRELLVDSTLLNAVMPQQRMAVGRTLIEPIEAPTQLAVEVVVGAWLRPTAGEGTMVAEGVVTEPEPGGGSVTRFVVRSTMAEAEEGVDVTALYRAADGRILSAESTTVEVVPAGGAVEAQIRLLAPIPGLASTEVLVGRGFAAQTIG